MVMGTQPAWPSDEPATCPGWWGSPCLGPTTAGERLRQNWGPAGENGWIYFSPSLTHISPDCWSSSHIQSESYGCDSECEGATSCAKYMASLAAGGVGVGGCSGSREASRPGTHLDKIWAPCDRVADQTAQQRLAAIHDGVWASETEIAEHSKNGGA